MGVNGELSQNSICEDLRYKTIDKFVRSGQANPI